MGGISNPPGTGGGGSGGFSGNYADLTGKPTLFSGNYADLSGKPALFTGAYADLTGKPDLGPVNNLGATAPPTLTDDTTKNYSPGSTWFMPATGDMWRCRSSVANNARWVKVDSADHPGYNSGKFYAPFNVGAPVAGRTLPTGSKYGFFGTIKQRTAISQLQALLTTVSSGGLFGMGIYNWDPAAGKVATLIGNTASISTGTSGRINGALVQGQQFLEQGNYVFLTEADNATAVFLAVGPSSFNHLGSVGSAAGFGVNASTQPGGIAIAGQTFGQWPADLSAASQVDAVDGRIPMLLFFVPSP